MQRRIVREMMAAGLALVATGFAPRAYAQAGGVSPEQRAKADGIYAEAVAAMELQDYAAACPKLEEVNQLTPSGIGARQTLAQCYERWGKLASAYANYVRAGALAAAAKQPAREREARDHAEALKPRLATITVAMSSGVRVLAALEVRADGEVLAVPRWGTPIPVDKGKHAISATADGKRAWEKAIDVTDDGASVTVTIDALVDVNPPAPPSAPTELRSLVVQATSQQDVPRPAVTSKEHFWTVHGVSIGTGVVTLALLGAAFGLGVKTSLDLVPSCDAAVIGCHEEDRSAAQRDAIAANILFGAATAAAAVTAVRFVYEARNRSYGVSVAPSRAGVGLRVWF